MFSVPAHEGIPSPAFRRSARVSVTSRKRMETSLKMTFGCRQVAARPPSTPTFEVKTLGGTAWS